MIITSEHDFSSANTYIHPGWPKTEMWQRMKMTWPVITPEAGGGGAEAVFAVTTGSRVHA